MSLVQEDEDTLTADGSEQDVYENTADFAVYQVTISLDNMAAGDVTTIRSYIKVLTTGGYEEAFYGVYAHDQGSKAVVRVPADEAQNDWKVTLEQSAGTNRDYDWHATTYQKNP